MPRKDFEAVVHSVFQSALNFRLSSETELLTLVSASEADLPQGIRIYTPDDFSFETFEVGRPVTCQDSYLHLDSLTVDLCHVHHWKCDLSKLEFDPTQPAVASARSFVWEVLNKRQRLSNSEIIADELFLQNESIRNSVARKISMAVHDLINITHQLELTDSTAIHSLIGLGSGLTPAGDDLLIGYLTGLRCASQHRSERIEFISALGKKILSLLPNTNDISRTYLYHATQGQVSSRVANLAEAICRGESLEYLAEISKAALRTGHTSGMDTVTGLLIGLAAWFDDHHLIPVYKTK